jgi:hypothetical protein
MNIPLEMVTCIAWGALWAIVGLWGFDAVMSERKE